MSKFALTNARHTASLSRLYRGLANTLAQRGDHLGAFSASLRSHRLAQVAQAWEVVA